jgi:hypothetical protein
LKKKAGQSSDIFVRCIRDEIVGFSEIVDVEMGILNIHASDFHTRRSKALPLHPYESKPLINYIYQWNYGRILLQSELTKGLP